MERSPRTGNGPLASVRGNSVNEGNDPRRLPLYRAEILDNVQLNQFLIYVLCS